MISRKRAPRGARTDRTISAPRASA
jgi:hypothetical protein